VASLHISISYNSTDLDISTNISGNFFLVTKTPTNKYIQDISENIAGTRISNFILKYIGTLGGLDPPPIRHCYTFIIVYTFSYYEAACILLLSLHTGSFAGGMGKCTSP